MVRRKLSFERDEQSGKQRQAGKRRQGADSSAKHRNGNCRHGDPQPTGEDQPGLADERK
jgi:hypothetical protein